MFFSQQLQAALMFRAIYRLSKSGDEMAYTLYRDTVEGLEDADCVAFLTACDLFDTLSKMGKMIVQ